MMPTRRKKGLMNQGVVVGQTWDGPPITLMQNGDPVQYRAPAEGSLAWVDGMSLSTAAEDIDAVYAFIDYCFAPEPAGKSIDGGGDSNWGGHGYNSAVLALIVSQWSIRQDVRHGLSRRFLGKPLAVAQGAAVVCRRSDRVPQQVRKRLIRQSSPPRYPRGGFDFSGVARTFKATTRDRPGISRDVSRSEFVTALPRGGL
ncbi:MAG: hypothetical protein CM1200mP20_02290 [Pseudomonadota bacterium]|nr:MAG: hypothetical protein CM1200mP20_02290 [Pseudomonadota bacterium]